MTIPVFVDGMWIDDSGMLVIDADEMDAAGVRSIELIEGEPDKDTRIEELQGQRDGLRIEIREGHALVAEFRVRLKEAEKLHVHLQHCNFGEHVGACKYGDENCPALTEEWNWLGWNLQKIKRCDDCDAMMNPIGKGIFECWKCADEAQRTMSLKLLSRAEKAEARLKEANRDAKLAASAMRNMVEQVSKSVNQRAEELMMAMARESWNDSVGRLEAIITACDDLGAELAIAANTIPTRGAGSVWVAFGDLEAALSPAEAEKEGKECT